MYSHFRYTTLGFYRTIHPSPPIKIAPAPPSLSLGRILGQSVQ